MMGRPQRATSQRGDMNWTESSRLSRVQTPMIPVVGEWIAKYPGTISLGQGIVHYAAPPAVAAAVADAAFHEPSLDRYCLVRGIAPLLEEIALKVATENQTTLDGRSLVITTGSNMAFLQAVLAIGDVDDEIILLSPYYFNHEMAIDIAGCRAVVVSTDENCQLDLTALEAAITPRTRAVVTVSPNNPTGAVYDRSSLMAVNQLCLDRGLYHVSDEAYEYFVYGEAKHFSPASLPTSTTHTVSLYTLSKAYGMAGWRVGYMVIPQHLEEAVKKVQDTNLVCPPIVNQLAALAAMQAGKAWCTSRIAGFEAVRDLVLAELAKLGTMCHVPSPAGAFYALVRLDTSKSDLELVEALIRDHGIAVMPGSTFGYRDGCALRVAYGALDTETVAEGMGRLVKGLERLV